MSEFVTKANDLMPRFCVRQRLRSMLAYLHGPWKSIEPTGPALLIISSAAA